MEWWNLIFSLVGVLIGAAISTFSQWSLAKSGHAQDDRKELRRAAADLVGTYGLAWSALIGTRMRGGAIPGDDELGYTDRNVKYSYFAMCLGADAHMDAVEANRLALKELVSAFANDEATWKRADQQMLRAQQLAQSSLRRLKRSWFGDLPLAGQRGVLSVQVGAARSRSSERIKFCGHLNVDIERA